MTINSATVPASPQARVGSVRIARDVARLIESGVYASGQRLREQEIADRFGSSRGPVREALRILESQGLVVVEQMRGARVVHANEADFLEVVRIRAGLAGVVAQRAAEEADPQAAQQLLEQTRLVLAETRNGASLDETYASLRTFARVLSQMSPSHRAQTMMQALSGGREAFQTMGLSTRSRRVQAAQIWVRVAEAIVARHPIKARDGILALYEMAIEHILTQTSDGVRAAEAPGLPGAAQR